jgi:hypothetical protein
MSNFWQPDPRQTVPATSQLHKLLNRIPRDLSTMPSLAGVAALLSKLSGTPNGLSELRCLCAVGLKWSRQMPAYQAYPPSGAAEPRPFPKVFRLSVTVIWVIYFTLL